MTCLAGFVSGSSPENNTYIAGRKINTDAGLVPWDGWISALCNEKLEALALLSYPATVLW